jgi:phosphatidylethanolamine-binding protein (PEBP) family uncharacterized protein
MPAFARGAALAGIVATVIAADFTPDAVAAMTLGFSWAGVSRCTTSPPAFVLTDVPAGTRRLAFNMVDLDLRSFRHGGGTMPYRGDNEVAAGSFSYRGPCPPPGQQHNYRWTVRALDVGGRTLATASATELFPPR